MRPPQRERASQGQSAEEQQKTTVLTKRLTNEPPLDEEEQQAIAGLLQKIEEVKTQAAQRRAEPAGRGVGDASAL